jgi:hypothetical protein
MLHINFSNIESLILENNELKHFLPSSCRGFIDQWQSVKPFPMLRELGKQALFDLINSFDDESIDALENFFNDVVVVEKLNYNTVDNLVLPINNDICDHLCKLRGFKYFSTWRDEKNLYITFWR